MNSDTDLMRRLDIELLRRGIYVLPGVRRFVASVTTDEDIDLTVAINTDNTGGQVTASGSHAVTILDDDTPRVVINSGNSDLTGDENGDTITFQVERQTGAPDALTVNFTLQH